MDIVQTGARVLRERAKDVDAKLFGTAELRALVDQMVEVMRKAPGVGLAAPQIGIGLRIFVVEDRPEYLSRQPPEQLAERERRPVPLQVFINPQLTPIGTERVTFVEGCLSVAGFAALVTRFREVEVRACDVEGNEFTTRVRGWPARILQHESDHLNGTLYLDRMYSRSFGTVEQIQGRTQLKSSAEVLSEFEVVPE